MALETDLFFKGLDNPVSWALQNDGVTITNVATELRIYIGDPIVAPVITRATLPANGVSYASGVVTVVPADLTEDLSALIIGRSYPVRILMIDAGNPNGVLFGEAGQPNTVNALISALPT